MLNIKEYIAKLISSQQHTSYGFKVGDAVEIRKKYRISVLSYHTDVYTIERISPHGSIYLAGSDYTYDPRWLRLYQK